jgi:large subunit ribosomal protein L5
MSTITSQEYKLNSHKAVQAALSSEIKNIFDLPSIDKVSINIGVGKLENKDKQDVYNYVYKITGQMPKQVKSRVSISNFKLRKGDVNGIMVTLRGAKMYDFLLDLVYIALPRIRDFKGLKKNAYDKNFSSYSLGISNCNIFPQVGFDNNANFGMQINIVFKNKSDKNPELMKALNLPFSKEITK